ncbi:AI-2E family transporter [Gordonia sp. (in: high G+C Gram-positive bacteria)]|uniref:AI-2E family transporter n=1 Tax=Gordonia sp. (in: high G+C Gram-positive bacteria) TaxID=84139 RepID=UPI0039E5F3D5
MTVIAILFCGYFLRSYLVLIGLAAVLAYLFMPLYRRFCKHMNSGLASTATLLSAIAIVVVPLAGILTMAGIQIKEMIDGVSHWLGHTDVTKLGYRVLDSTNRLLDKIPFVHAHLTVESVQEQVSKLAVGAGNFALGIAKGSVGGIANGVTIAIIFLYVFIALLGNGARVAQIFKDLNPLSPEVSDIYLSKIGAMVTATVRGQFIIAFVQGTLGAISIWLGGIHQGFFMFLIFLTALSIIPLGSGIVTIPLGIGMALTGNIVGGVFVALWHIIVITNVDNVLRPMLVPTKAHLNPALMMLAVFAGMKMFGFAGIVFGPVVMIIVVTTIDLYRSVNKGVWIAEYNDDDSDADPPKKPKWWHRIGALFTSKKAVEAADDVPADEASESS